MNIIYIAYSCDPYKGSEDKIGWNVPIESAKLGNRVIVITKPEQKNNIEKKLNKEKDLYIDFVYIDIPKIYKLIFKGMFYSGRLNIWNRRTYKYVKKIVRKKKIDLIHQITPIEFRAIGSYYKIENVRFVMGPIGGGEYMNVSLFKSLSLIEKLIEIIRYSFNLIYKLKFCMIKKKIDFIMYSNKETGKFLNISNGLLLPEFGLTSNEIVQYNKSSNDIIKFVVAGRMIYRKGHSILLDALKKLPETKKYKVVFIGDGPMMAKLRKKVNKLGLSNKVSFYGKVDYDTVKKIYINSDVLIMPSLRETTGNVILEALSNGMPVIAYDGFGSSVVLSNTTGYLYSGKTKNEIINDMAKKIEYCIDNYDLIKSRRKDCVSIANQYLFSDKVVKYNDIYFNVIRDRNDYK